MEAHLAEEGGLLVSGDAADGDAAEERADAVGGAGALAAGGDDGGHEGAGDIEEGQELVVPSQFVDVEEQGAGGVGDVGEVLGAGGELPDEPGVDGAEGELATVGAGAGVGNVFEEPGDLAGGEVGVEDEAGAGLEEGLVAVGAELVAEGGVAAVLPDEGVVDGLAGGAVPDEGGLALVGDADGGDIGCGEVLLFEESADGGELRGPDGLRVLFDPAVLGVDLGEFALGGGEDDTVMVDDDGAGAARALIEGEDETHR